MHECACVDCEKQIPSSMLMCKPHWFMVSKATRNAVWHAYTKRGVMSDEYWDAVDKAVGEVVRAEAGRV